MVACHFLLNINVTATPRDQTWASPRVDIVPRSFETNTRWTGAPSSSLDTIHSTKGSFTIYWWANVKDVGGRWKRADRLVTNWFLSPLVATPPTSAALGTYGETQSAKTNGKRAQPIPMTGRRDTNHLVAEGRCSLDTFLSSSRTDGFRDDSLDRCESVS